MKTQFLPTTYALRDSKKTEYTTKGMVIDGSSCTTREDRIIKSIETLTESVNTLVFALCATIFRFVMSKFHYFLIF
jgi:hypothetical protein